MSGEEWNDNIEKYTLQLITPDPCSAVFTMPPGMHCELCGGATTSSSNILRGGRWRCYRTAVKNVTNFANFDAMDTCHAAPVITLHQPVQAVMLCTRPEESKKLPFVVSGER